MSYKAKTINPTLSYQGNAKLSISPGMRNSAGVSEFDVRNAGWLEVGTLMVNTITPNYDSVSPESINAQLNTIIREYRAELAFALQELDPHNMNRAMGGVMDIYATPDTLQNYIEVLGAYKYNPNSEILLKYQNYDYTAQTINSVSGSVDGALVDGTDYTQQQNGKVWYLVLFQGTAGYSDISDSESPSAITPAGIIGIADNTYAIDITVDVNGTPTTKTLSSGTLLLASSTWEDLASNLNDSATAQNLPVTISVVQEGSDYVIRAEHSTKKGKVGANVSFVSGGTLQTALDLISGITIALTDTDGTGISTTNQDITIDYDAQIMKTLSFNLGNNHNPAPIMCKYETFNPDYNLTIYFPYCVITGNGNYALKDDKTVELVDFPITLEAREHPDAIGWAGRDPFGFMIVDQE